MLSCVEPPLFAAYIIVSPHEMPMISQFPLDFSTIFTISPAFLYDFPMISPAFSYDFPMAFLWFPLAFPLPHWSLAPGVAFVVRSPGQVTTLLAARADFAAAAALNGAASRANTETVRALLTSRCDPDFPGGEWAAKPLLADDWAFCYLSYIGG